MHDYLTHAAVLGWLASSTQTSFSSAPSGRLLSDRYHCPHTCVVVQVKAANSSADSKDALAAQKLLETVCCMYFNKQAKYTDSQRYEKLRYDMLIAALDGAIPQHNAALVGFDTCHYKACTKFPAFVGNVLVTTVVIAAASSFCPVHRLSTGLHLAAPT